MAAVPLHLDHSARSHSSRTVYARLSAACLQVIDRVMLSRAGLTVPGPNSTLEQHQQHALYVLYLLTPSPFLLMSRIYQHRRFRYLPHLLCHHPSRLMCPHPSRHLCRHPLRRPCVCACPAATRCQLQGCVNGFALVRPPGHHAGRNGHTTGAPSCGFCLLNNVCIGECLQLVSPRFLSAASVSLVHSMLQLV